MGLARRISYVLMRESKGDPVCISGGLMEKFPQPSSEYGEKAFDIPVVPIGFFRRRPDMDVERSKKG
jgi:hypothetical protein